MPLYWTGSASFAPPVPGAAVAIGNFDGVHLGHRAVLRRLKAEAAAAGVVSVVYTFDPAPTAIVAPERHQPRLQTLAARVAGLLAQGIDHVVVEAFTQPFAALPAAEFASEYLDRRLGARVLVVGYDFRFGSMRGGDAARLHQWLPNLHICEVAPLTHGDEPVSSSRIRKLVAAGNVHAAAELLGHPHRITGPVQLGDQRGRTIGFPTANVAMQEELRPGTGVYAAHFEVDGATHLAAVNIGTRPTVDGTRFSVEAHLLDFAGDLYGKQVGLDLIARVRDEQRFAGLDALKAQIALDVDAVRRVLA